ncbi:Alkylmercury lyase (modular protein) [Methylacidimicrobium sp. AP8]|uniref:DF family (seleno)protein n=1 Tax=Methylacidimicrobium sp. AP8 TaxID=2730359 RepID=UPI0018C038CE|nr:hypothetical protein [Methylacidimicrobium sp. AP8]CAB4242525.1 Alkylmercury lyase (modular protein) [Methylacidimicrobium sp. AP8]
MQIELFYFDSCPHWTAALRHVEEVLVEEGGIHEIRLIPIRTLADAQRHRFFGSPTIRIEDRDIDPAAWGRLDYGFGCRLYPRADGSIHPIPSKEFLRQAFRLHRPLSIAEAHGEVLESIRRQHPEWAAESMAECSRCVRYEYELADPLGSPSEE